MEIEELQKIQKEHDYEYWDHDSNELENIRHITLHVGKLLGKLAAYCEAHEHQRDFQNTQILVASQCHFGFLPHSLLRRLRS